MITELMAIKLIAFLCPPESSAVIVGQDIFWLRIMVSVLSSGQMWPSTCALDPGYRASTQLSSSLLLISIQINQ